MLKNYFKTAWRNLIKNKSFSLINILGLSVGISVCFIIMMYVLDELSYDRFNKNADQIVRISFKANINGGKINEATVMAPTAQALKSDYPEVELATRLRDYGIPKVTFDNKKFNAGRFAFVDANFFSVFTIPFLQGDPANALQVPNAIVITDEMANTYFGNQDPIGKTLQFNSYGDALFKVTAVVKKMPS